MEGTEEDLRDFMQEFVEGIEEWCDGNWEEDRSHNMLTYKASRIVLKQYSSTKTVLVQGKDHFELRTKLLKLTEVSQNASPIHQVLVNDESINEFTRSDNDYPSPPPLNQGNDNTLSACSLCTVLSKDMETVIRRLDGMTERLSSVSEQRVASPKDTQELMSLRVKCEQYEEKIRKLEEERASLLLVISLVAREANETNCGDRPNSNVVRDVKEISLGDRSSNDTQNANEATVSDSPVDNSVVEKKKKKMKKRNSAQLNTSNINCDPKPSQPPQSQAQAGQTNPKKRVVIVGDSMVRGIHGWKISKARNAPSVSVKSCHGATIEDMESYAIQTVRAQPEEIILHVGTNDLLQHSTSQHVAESIVNLADNIDQNSGSSKIAISSLVKRLDKPHLSNKLSEINSILRKFARNRGWSYISNDNIGQATQFNHSGLHLSRSGNSQLASNLIKHFSNNNN